jgi:ATP-binding cassette subfamily C (CFTR/MRP) protein 1
LIGELKCTEGEITYNGNLAYCAQQPWILSDTLRNNILFYRELDEHKLEQVIHVCGLEHDFKELPQGDLTVIGENGVNLSGGQKARVALARALYQNNDILLLDDPLSALDAQVGRFVFENAIMKALNGKTVLLVTHQLQFIQQLDYIIVVDDGNILEHGNYNDLMSKKGRLYNMMHTTTVSKRTLLKKEDVQQYELNEMNNDHDIIVKEDQVKGAVRSATYKRFIEASGGWYFVISVATLGVLFAATLVMSNIWLQWWTDRQVRFGKEPLLASTTTFYQIGYGVLGGIQLIFSGFFF